MAIGFIGADHTRASLLVRDRLAVAGDTLDLLLDRLRADPHIDEAAVLSTCNRTEVYVVAPDAPVAIERAGAHLLAVTGVTPDEVAGMLESLTDDEAARRLFAVAAGLRSLVQGETQILTQVREAFAYAGAREAAGASLGALARAAVSCGKRVRAQTSVGSANTSVSAVVVAMAQRRLEPLRERTALLIGAGRINAVSAQLLRDAGVGALIVVSRTQAAAEQIAARCDGRAAPLHDLPLLLATADLAIAATRAPAPLITPATILPRDPTRPLLLFDIAVPRDVEPAVGTLPGVELVNIDGVRASAPEGAEVPESVVDAWRLVDACVEQYLMDVRVRQAVPLIARLRAHVDRNKDAELARTLAGLEHLAPQDREAVALLAHRLVNHMFHHLAVRLKAAAGRTDGGAYLEALAFLFEEEGTEDLSVAAAEADGERTDRAASTGAPPPGGSTWIM